MPSMLVEMKPAGTNAFVFIKRPQIRVVHLGFLFDADAPHVYFFTG